MEKKPQNFGARFGLQVNAPVFLISAAIIFLSVILTVVDVKRAEQVFDRLQAAIANNMGWLYVLAVNVFLLFVIYLLFSRFGRIRLGGDGSKPEFGTLSWFSMLFSAGMGIGLLFYSVAEPIMHFSNPPMGEPGGIEAAETAMAATFFHWGLHAWGIYALVGLALAFFAFRRGLPLTIRSAFYPLLGERIYGPIGHLIDIVAVVATLFGVATSLGLGVQQVNAGLEYLFDVEQGVDIQVLLIAVITGMATTSVVLGLDRGIRRLSEFTMILGAILLVFMLVAGPTLFLIDATVQNVGGYMQRLPQLSTWTESYRQEAFFDLELRSINDSKQLPEEGTNLVVVAKDTESQLHFRTFDSTGIRVVDSSEAQLADRSDQINELKGKLTGLWDLEQIEATQKQGILKTVRTVIGDSRKEWQNGWTIFYWGWWIAWSPFVGMFIARISRGRTVREFLLGVLLVPSVVTFFWLTVFGGTALYQELSGASSMVAAVNESIPTALFVLFDQFPFSAVASFVAVTVVVVFFVTSSDSGSLVIDIITAGGSEEPPVKQRIFWAVLEGIVAAVLLLVGGKTSLAALQTASITTGLPFAIVLIIMCFGLARGLAQDYAQRVEREGGEQPERTGVKR